MPGLSTRIPTQDTFEMGTTDAELCRQFCQSCMWAQGAYLSNLRIGKLGMGGSFASDLASTCRRAKSSSWFVGSSRQRINTASAKCAKHDGVRNIPCLATRSVWKVD